MSADLGCNLLRMFAAWPGVTLGADGGRYDLARRIWETAHESFSPEQTWAWSRDGLIEMSRNGYALDSCSPYRVWSWRPADVPMRSLPCGQWAVVRAQRGRKHGGPSHGTLRQERR